jgi:hypothetical protein
MKFIKGSENRNEIFIFSRWIDQLSLLIREKLALEGDYHVIRLRISQALKAFCSGSQIASYSINNLFERGVIGCKSRPDQGFQSQTGPDRIWIRWSGLPDRTGPDRTGSRSRRKILYFCTIIALTIHMISYFSKNSRLASKRAKDNTVCIDGPKKSVANTIRYAKLNYCTRTATVWTITVTVRLLTM